MKAMSQLLHFFVCLSNKVDLIINNLCCPPSSVMCYIKQQRPNKPDPVTIAFNAVHPELLHWDSTHHLAGIKDFPPFSQSPRLT